MIDTLMKARETLGSLLRWWLAELRFLLPRRLRERVESGTVPLRLEIQGDEAVAVGTGSGESAWFDLGVSGHPQRLASLLRARRGHRDVALVLPAGDSLARVIDLPLAVEENLAQVLSYEMDRHTPFSAAQVHYGFRVLERRPEQGRIRVRLVVAPRATIDSWLHRFSQWGIVPERVESHADESINLLPTARGRSVRRGARWNAILSAVVVAMLLALVIVPLWHMRQVAVLLTQEVSALERAARDATDLQQRYDDLRRQVDFLVHRRSGRPYTVHVLDELARVLPDHTWVQSLEISGPAVTIHGSSRSASGLIEIIEASPVFEGVSFAAPVTKHPQTGADVFRISARLRETVS